MWTESMSLILRARRPWCRSALDAWSIDMECKSHQMLLLNRASLSLSNKLNIHQNFFYDLETQFYQLGPWHASRPMIGQPD